VKDKRDECIQPNAADSCQAEHVQMETDVGSAAVRQLSQLTGPGVEQAISAASDLADPKDGVACVQTQSATSCFFASPDANRKALVLDAKLAKLKENSDASTMLESFGALDSLVQQQTAWAYSGSGGCGCGTTRGANSGTIIRPAFATRST
jgi:hypothetical protein